MAQTEIEQTETKAISKWFDYPKDDLEAFEGLFVSIHNNNMNKLLTEMLEKRSHLAKRQDEVSFLHKLIGALNAASNEKGEVDLDKNPELHEMLEKAKGMGVRLPILNKNIVSARQKEEYIHSVRMTVDDENTLIELDMQQFQNLNYILHESYQWMRSHTKTLEDIKKKFKYGQH